MNKEATTELRQTSSKTMTKLFLKNMTALNVFRQNCFQNMMTFRLMNKESKTDFRHKKCQVMT